MTHTISTPAHVKREPDDPRCVTLTDANGSTVTHQLADADAAQMVWGVLIHDYPEGDDK